MNTNFLTKIDCNVEKLKIAFAESLKKIRKYTKFTLIELEKLTGIANPSLSRYENGKVEPSISQAIIIAEAFFLSVTDFVLYGLNIQPEYTTASTIIERFEENIAYACWDIGEKADKILKKIYTKIDIDKILKKYDII